MPFAKLPKRPGTAQNAFGPIFVRGNVSQGQGVGEEHGRRHFVRGGGDDYVAGALNLQGEELIGTYRRVVGHADQTVVWPQLAEDDVEGGGSRALAGQLVGEPAINVPRPIQTGAESQRSICPDKIDAAFVDGNETE